MQSTAFIAVSTALYLSYLRKENPSSEKARSDSSQ